MNETSPVAPPRGQAALRSLIIALTAFFTVVDLFATQAILPILVHAYRVTPAQMGVAVNASTLGMAVAGLAVAMFSRRIDRRTGIVVSLIVLALPTALLAHAPDLMVFTWLRVAQGLCMATAFTLMLAYLGEHCSPADQAGAFAAYITGNVASNLVGRFIAAAVAGQLGLATNFYLFAGLNLVGAALAWITVQGAPSMAHRDEAMSETAAQRLRALTAPNLLAGFGVGFCILFAFIGVFTYVNFVLVRPPLSLGMMSVGVVYLVFLPSIVLTPQAGRIAARFGTRVALWTGLGVALIGLPLLVSGQLPLVLAGMTLVGSGTFFAQATATGFVSRAATDRAAASGVYLAAYFTGGLVGTAVLGAIFDRFGWEGCIAGVAIAIGFASLLGLRLRLRGDAAA
jgi:YNFM family putative membrane transporter